MDADDFRRIALGLEGAIEGAHMGHPDFRAGGRIFASIHPDPRVAMVKLSPEQQEQFVTDHPRAFAPEAGPGDVRDTRRSNCTRWTRTRLARR
jgi:hypothetical protein